MARSQQDILNLDDDGLKLLWVFMSLRHKHYKDQLEIWGKLYLELMDGDDEKEEHIAYLKAIHYRESLRNIVDTLEIIENKLERRELQ